MADLDEMRCIVNGRAEADLGNLKGGEFEGMAAKELSNEPKRRHNQVCSSSCGRN